MRIRTDLRIDDIPSIVDLHGQLARDQGWNAMFKAYVASSLLTFHKSASARRRIWIAEADAILGTLALVEAGDAQLRWLLVAPEARNQGTGQRLLNEAIHFARDQGYGRVFLWTETGLQPAARLYLSAGFQKIEEKKSWKWGANIVEEQWELVFRPRTKAST